MKIQHLFYFIFILSLSSCIKDDFIDDFQKAELRISTAIDSLALDSTYQFEVMYLNNVGQEEMANAEWTSNQPDVISISSTGLAHALQTGSALLTVSYNNGTDLLKDSLLVHVGMTTVIMETQKSGMVATTSSYTLSGDFTLDVNGDDLELVFTNNYIADTALPGLYVYLSNNPNSSAGAYEIGPVQVFSGAHSYTIPATGINDYAYVLYYCKPFNVKVGHGEIQ